MKQLRLTALQMRMITLALLIILVLRLGGAMAAAALNGLDSAGFPLPGRAGYCLAWGFWRRTHPRPSDFLTFD